MVPAISIFIPVYGESELLEPLLVDLTTDLYENKDIFVVVDKPTPESLELVDAFKDRVHFKLNGERKGKVNVLNELVKESRGEILLFLDSDVQIDCSSGDLDMGIRSFKEGIRFKYLEDIAVQTRIPSSWRMWFKQRKRWGVGTALFLKEYFRDLVRIVRKYPRVPLSILFIFPSLPLLLIDLPIPDEHSSTRKILEKLFYDSPLGGKSETLKNSKSY